MRSPANSRTRSSSADRKKRDAPGSPWRPERPRSWLSIRRDSWRSVPQMKRPPASFTFSRSSATCCSIFGNSSSHALFRLDRLVKALRPAPALEDAAGELVDDLHLAVDHLVLDAALVERLSLQRLDEVVDEVAMLGLVQVVDAEELLRLRDA